MAMPHEFTLVRHGESEINVVQNAEDYGEHLDFADAIKARPDWRHRLLAPAPDGVPTSQSGGNNCRRLLGYN